jgi:hypothetical protein
VPLLELDPLLPDSDPLELPELLDPLLLPEFETEEEDPDEDPVSTDSQLSIVEVAVGARPFPGAKQICAASTEIMNPTEVARTHFNTLISALDFPKNDNKERLIRKERRKLDKERRRN